MSPTAQTLTKFADGYLGYTVVEEYDTAACAVKCTEKEGCLAFNIFFEVGSEPSGFWCCIR